MKNFMHAHVQVQFEHLYREKASQKLFTYQNFKKLIDKQGL